MASPQELTRRAAIAGYAVIGEPPEPDLEGLVQVAATLCGVPTAVVNIIDDRYQHQVATVGVAAAMCSRDDSMCAIVFENPGHVVVHDARADPRFVANPFVTGQLANVRFYASSPLVTPSGVPIGTLCVFDDVVGEISPAASKALELLAHQVVEVLELRRAARLLSRTNAELSHFAGQVSHDLRNPLNAVSGFIEVAADDPELAHAPNAVRALARAESAVARMDAMIRELLDYAKTGGAIASRPDVDLEGIVRAVVDDLDADLRSARARIVCDAPVLVRGDELLLRALLQNLIANAVKFTAAAGREPFIEVQALRVQAGWRVTVDDNGPGVAVEDRERVFVAMERGDRSTPGIGLGLATCRRIVEAHGGLIGIDESHLGGASVWFLLPDAEE
ncbi:GAF domain-containing sensor histidine kinase [Microbacterium sp.]|jgi:signal transduction histidine kinase|uniref:GAF domain-containing sensor histidine kinase n=1 Tax=Microbacterium sp. TaxID=51671 RepID=UPI002726A662|nr:GAF domain-containing sensor histidine kinase [Microbacterium sp.]MDO8383507.1 GAF domain-containing sensor histidine kinase [Microbacterium sp.]